MIVMLTPKRTVGEKNIQNNTKKNGFSFGNFPLYLSLSYMFYHFLQFFVADLSEFFCSPKRHSLGFLPVGTPHPKSWPQLCPAFAGVFLKKGPCLLGETSTNRRQRRFPGTYITYHTIHVCHISRQSYVVKNAHTSHVYRYYHTLSYNINCVC